MLFFFFTCVFFVSEWFLYFFPYQFLDVRVNTVDASNASINYPVGCYYKSTPDPKMKIMVNVVVIREAIITIDKPMRNNLKKKSQNISFSSKRIYKHSKNGTTDLR